MDAASVGGGERHVMHDSVDHAIVDQGSAGDYRRPEADAARREQVHKATEELEQLEHKIQLGEIKKRALEFVAALERVPSATQGLSGRVMKRDTADVAEDEAVRV